MALICIIAFAAFAVMGIFSAKYRKYAGEAFHCFLNTVRLRKCDTGLDEKIKAEMVSRILPYSPPVAKAVHGHFEFISSAFVILMFASSAYSAIGFYNFAVYGNCNGPAGGFCVLKDIADGATVGKPSGLASPQTRDGQAFGNANHNVIIYEFGCYACTYTAKAEPIVQQLYSEYGDRVEFVYKPFPLPDHPYSNEAALASWCAYEQGTEKYMLYRRDLFEGQEEWKAGGSASIIRIAEYSGLDMERFKSCYASGKYQAETDEVVEEGKDIGVYGTPTFFIGGRKFVGVVTYEELMDAIEEELKK